MRTMGKPVRPFQSVQQLLAKLQDPRGSTSHCLRYWGWGKSANKPNWYCPKHVESWLEDQKPPNPDCECPKRWPWNDIPKVPHHLAAQQDAEWVKDSGLLPLEDGDAAALAAQWSRDPRVPPLD